jgi:hypothetical protein
MSISIQVAVDGRVLRGKLFTTVSALKLVDRLPVELEMERRGEEYVGKLDPPLGLWLAPEAREALKPGELALWPEANALRMALGESSSSPANPIGVLEDVQALRELGPKVRVRIEPVDGPGRGATD